MNHRNILTFLSIAFGISWLIIFLLGDQISASQGFGGTLGTFAYRWGPAIAAIMVVRRIAKGSTTDLGLTARDQIEGKWFFAGIGWSVFLLPLTILLTYLLGNLGGLEAIGHMNFDKARILAEMTPEGVREDEIPAYLTDMSPGLLLLLTGFTQFLLGTTLYVAYTYGEELGWRGFLVQQTKKAGFWTSGLMVGVASAFWYFPIWYVLGGVRPGSLLSFLTIAIFYLSLSFPLIYFARKSGTLLAPACMQGIIAALSGTLLVFMTGSENPAAGMMGICGILICLTTTACIAVIDKEFISSYSQEAYPISTNK